MKEPDDQRFLEEELGVGPLFPPDTALHEIVESLMKELPVRKAASAAP